MNNQFKKMKKIIGLVVPVILLFSAMTPYTFEAQTEKETANETLQRLQQDNEQEMTTLSAQSETMQSEAQTSFEQDTFSDGQQAETETNALNDEVPLEVDADDEVRGGEATITPTEVIGEHADTTEQNVELSEHDDTSAWSVELKEFATTVENFAGPTLSTPKTLAEIFPDEVFAKEIARGLNQGVNELVTQEKLNQLTGVHMQRFLSSTPQVTSIEGLQYAHNISNITLTGHGVSDISVLRSLFNLNRIDLARNQITNIQPLTGLTQLTNLSLGSNKITDLTPLRQLTNLTALDIASSGSDDVRMLAGLTKLQKLDISNNNLSDLRVLQPLTHLRELRLAGNNLTELTSIVSFLNLEFLSVRNNPLSDISAVSKLSNLRALDIAWNTASSNDKIKDFSPLRALTKLKNLNIAGKLHVSQIPVDVLERLDVLDASNYPYVDITPFLGLTHLKELFLGNTGIEDVSPLATKSWPNLTQLALSNNYIVDITPLAAGHFPQLHTLTLNNQKNKLQLRLAYQPVLSVENTIKDFAGNLITPNGYKPQGTGTYEAPNVEWRLPVMKNTFVNYTWSQNLKLWNASVSYSGQYNATVYEHYQVEFIVDDAVYESIDVKAQSAITPPTVEPNKAGHTFIGWYTAREGGEKWNFRQLVVRPLQLYAHFDTNPYKLTYVHHGAIVEETFDVSFGQLLPDSTLPQKRGYTLNWYVDETYSEKWDLASDTMPAHDVTLYGRYDINDYMLTYIVGETGIEEAFNVVFEQPLPVASVPEKLGYTLKWYKDEQYTAEVIPSEMTMPAEDVLLYGRYEVNKYNVVYVVDDEHSSTTVDFGTLLVQPDDPMKEGYTFLGWYDEEGNNWDFAFDTMPANELLLYARYEIIKSNVTYMIDDEVLSIEQNVPYGHTLTEVFAPDKEGYIFRGWFRAIEDVPSANDDPWDFEHDTMPANDVILYGRYTEAKYELTYDDGQGNVSTPLFITYGNVITAETPQPEAPTKPFHVFLGWSEGLDEDTPLWNFEHDTMPAHNLTLHARYEVMKFNLRYNDMQGNVSEPVQVAYNSLLIADAIMPEDPEKHGHEFLGWSTTPRESASNRGEMWDFYIDTMPGHDLMLYARYENEKFALLYADAQGVLTEPIEVPFDKHIDVKSAPMPAEREGYVFVGWYTNGAEMDEEEDRRWDFGKDLMPAHDLTLYARYRALQFDWTLQGSQITMYEDTFLHAQASAGPDFAQELIHLSAAQVFNEKRIQVYDTENTGNGLFVVMNLPVLQTIQMPGQYEVHIAYFDQAGTGNEAVIGEIGLTILAGADPNASIDDEPESNGDDGASSKADREHKNRDGVSNVQTKARANKLTRSGGYTVELIFLSLFLLLFSLVLVVLAAMRRKNNKKVVTS